MHRPPALFRMAFIALLACCALPNSVQAAWVTSDMSLRDWGITVKDTSSPSYTGFTNQSTPAGTLTKREKTYNGFEYFYAMEDSNDTWGASSTLGPNKGGQNYDAEFIGIGTYEDQVVIAILTGQRPDNGFSNYAPGDIKISTVKNGVQGVYGVEVGGGAGGATGSATTKGGLGTNYQTKSDGSTIGALNSDGSYVLTSSQTNLSTLISKTSGDGSRYHPEQVAGSIWFNPVWLKDPISNPITDVQVQFSGGTRVGMADSFMNTGNVKTLNAVGSNPDTKPKVYQHAIIEVAIPLSVFMNATITGVAWAPACGNDIMEIKKIKINTTPEPTSLALMGFGGLATCVIGARRRRRAFSS
jgi:hypothetical protein